MPFSKGRTVKPSGRQIGKTHILEDRKRLALTPGRRVSAEGKKYTENRKNRSDLLQRKRL